MVLANMGLEVEEDLVLANLGLEVEEDLVLANLANLVLGNEED